MNTPIEIIVRKLPIYKENLVPKMDNTHIGKLIEPLEDEYIYLYGFEEDGNYIGISGDWFIDKIFKRIQERLPAYKIELIHFKIKCNNRFVYALHIKKTGEDI